MISTFTSYRLYSQDLPTSLARTAAQPNVARDVQYYQDNIGKVTSVDQLLKDRRLFSIAMKAHGLEDMTYATAFMRKVLESDLNDTSSFARKLADPRYIELARSFNFTTSGAVSQSLPYGQRSRPGRRYGRALFRAPRQAGRRCRHRGAILPEQDRHTDFGRPVGRRSRLFAVRADIRRPGSQDRLGAVRAKRVDERSLRPRKPRQHDPRSALSRLGGGVLVCDGRQRCPRGGAIGSAARRHHLQQLHAVG